jgi:hypothetical protein
MPDYGPHVTPLPEGHEPWMTQINQKELEYAKRQFIEWFKPIWDEFQSGVQAGA